jgi:penicillin-binding protein 1C
VPSNFGGFEPKNFDKQFHGKVTAEFALANSLNIPAVKLLKDISTASMIEKLKKAEFQTIKKKCFETRIITSVGRLWCYFGGINQSFQQFCPSGTFTKATLLAEENPNKPTEILSEDATFLINQILSR